MKSAVIILLVLGFMVGAILGALVGMGVAKDKVRCINGVVYFHSGNGVYTRGAGECVILLDQHTN